MFVRCLQSRQGKLYYDYVSGFSRLDKLETKGAMEVIDIDGTNLRNYVNPTNTIVLRHLYHFKFEQDGKTLYYKVWIHNNAESGHSYYLQITDPLVNLPDRYEYDFGDYQMKIAVYAHTSNCCVRVTIAKFRDVECTQPISIEDDDYIHYHMNAYHSDELKEYLLKSGLKVLKNGQAKKI